MGGRGGKAGGGGGLGRPKAASKPAAFSSASIIAALRSIEEKPTDRDVEILRGFPRSEGKTTIANVADRLGIKDENMPAFHAKLIEMMKSGQIVFGKWNGALHDLAITIRPTAALGRIRFYKQPEVTWVSGYKAIESAIREFRGKIEDFRFMTGIQLVSK